MRRTNNVSASPVARRSLGTILIECGKLTVENADYILGVQGKQGGVRFGEAARMLGLLTDDDIQFALARQYGYPCLRSGESGISEELVAAYQPRSQQVEALRALRSQLIQRCLGGEGTTTKSIAIVSPGRREGRSCLAANLAVVFSQLGQSTLLIDADMRHGRQHQLFDVDNAVGLSSVLSGRIETAPVVQLTDLAALSILPVGPLPPNPQELLGGINFLNLLDKFSTTFDAVIIDTPAAADYADAQMITALAGGALMLVRQDHTNVKDANGLREQMRQFNVSVIGAVLSEF
jgi:receptor protein-tyrosine kinase